MIVRMPASRARRAICVTGKVTIGDVMWLTTMTRVRSVTPSHSAAIIASGVVIGVGMGWMR